MSLPPPQFAKINFSRSFETESRGCNSQNLLRTFLDSFGTTYRDNYLNFVKSGACIIKLFTDVINSVIFKPGIFVICQYILLALTNTLALYVTKLITAVKSFMIQAPEFEAKRIIVRMVVRSF